jgi:hypothetical protein
VIVSDEHVAALRAILVRDFDEHRLLSDNLDATGGWAGFDVLIQAAFFEAVHRRFGKAYTTSDVVTFVADTRSRLDRSWGDIDPTAAERLVLSTLGDGSVDDIDDWTLFGTELVLLGALVAAEGLDEAGVDEFLVYSRELAVMAAS